MNILTFDVEEWFHILDNESTSSESKWRSYEYRLQANMDRLLAFLSDHDQKATFFILGWVAAKFPTVVREIHDAGFQVGSHSYHHQLAYTQSREEFRHDLMQSVQVIEDIIGSKVDIYRAPGFSLKAENTWVLDVLMECGIQIDCSVFPARRAHGGFEQFGYAEPAIVNHNGKQIKEFPLNLGQFLGKRLVFSGGGYFRFLPYFLIRKFMIDSDYVMTYFHPRDFDPGQPVIRELSAFRRFKSYYGLAGAFDKLEKLVRDFDFIDLAEADQRTDWNSVKTVSL